jgi:gliding motility-associatede transport system auxiliary component
MAISPQKPPSFSPYRRWKIGLDIVVRTALVLAVVMMVNYLSAQFFHRFYMSSHTRITLSSRTLDVLHSLTNHVNVTVYYNKNDEMYPTVMALLDEYQLADPKISVRVVDYIRDAGEAEKIKEKYKLSSVVDKDLIIFDCKEQGEQHVKIVPGDALVQYTLQQIPNEKEREFRKKPVAFYGEMTFTSMLLAVTNPKPYKAYFLQGHGEPSLTDTGNFGYSKFATVLAQNYIEVTNLDLLNRTNVPMDCNLLIIAGPQRPLADNELQAISQYLEQGGRMFVLMDYASINQPTGLEPILQQWGVNVIDDYVKDPENTQDGQDVIIHKYNRHPLTNPLIGYSLQMILPRPVERVKWGKKPANAPDVTELAFSSDDSTLAYNPAAPPRSYPLITAVEQKPVAGSSKPRGTTRILVTGDSFFLGNHYIDGGTGGVNRDFLSYAVNWLLDRPNLIKGIGPRPVVEFRLTMTRQQQQDVRWLLLAALPGAILLLGGLTWLARRK